MILTFPVEEQSTPIQGQRQFEFAAPKAKQVCLVGDFNYWDPMQGLMKKGLDGIWKTTLILKPGSYEYLFLVDGIWCQNANNMRNEADCFWIENCIVNIEG